MTILLLAEIWLYIGLAVAIIFIGYGLDRVEENAHGSYFFRPLLVPGVILLWPLVLSRWMTVEKTGYDKIRRDRPLRGGHFPVWMVLAIAIPALFIGAMLIRQSPPQSGDGAVQLAAPDR